MRCIATSLWREIEQVWRTGWGRRIYDNQPTKSVRSPNEIRLDHWADRSDKERLASHPTSNFAASPNRHLAASSTSIVQCSSFHITERCLCLSSESQPEELISRL